MTCEAADEPSVVLVIWLEGELILGNLCGSYIIRHSVSQRWCFTIAFLPCSRSVIIVQDETLNSLWFDVFIIWWTLLCKNCICIQ
jgi:hypothetical protein